MVYVVRRNDAGDLLVEVFVLGELVAVPESQYGLGCGGGRLCRDRVFHLDGRLPHVYEYPYVRRPYT